MLHSRMKWICAKPSPERVDSLAKSLQISPLLAQMLVVRGIEDGRQARLFLHGSLDELHDPFLLQGMGQAVERIRLALERTEKIRIYGDYDADGVSSTSLMIYLFRQLGAHFDYYIPHRTREGYGLHVEAIDAAKEQGISLIVTVDTGISAVEQIAHAAAIGIDVIVTDHHEPPEVLPQAYTLVNPKIPGCPYPFKELAGVGVAFKLAHALLGRVPTELLELATLGTIADLMPLVGENRILVRYGIERMRRTEMAGVRALLEIANVEVQKVTSTNVAFAMAPRINASGRLAHADQAVKLLTTSDDTEAGQLAFKLDELNQVRQGIVEDILREAMDQLDRKMIETQTGAPPDVIVLAGEGWNVGVIGIVASKILERHYRPTLILGIDSETGLCKGSARSIDGFDLYEALTECAPLLDHFGGHQAAAGLTLECDQLPALEMQLNEIARRKLTPEHFIESIEVDMECSLQDASLQNIDELEQLAPFGMANPSPRFVLRGIKIADRRLLGKEKQHLKLSLSDERQALDAIAFNRAAWADLIAENAAVDVLGELQVNEWNGRRKPQMMLQDLCVPHVQFFDGRGEKEPVAFVLNTCRTIQTMDSRSSMNSMGKQAVLASESYWQEAGVSSKINLAEISLWVYDRKVGMRPGNTYAEQVDTSDVQCLYIMDLPKQLAELELILQCATSLERVYAVYGGYTVRDRLILPSRDQFKQVYAELMRKRSWMKPRKEDMFLEGIAQRTGLSSRTIRHMMNVFEELFFIEEVSGMVQMATNPQKADLTTAMSYQQLMLRSEVEQKLLASTTEQLSAWIRNVMKQSLN